MNAEARMLAHYQAVADTVARMLEAAREADWDALLEHERGCGQLIEQLRNGIEHAPLEGGAARRKAALIRQMLGHDAEIRRLTQPWLARVESLLRTDSNRRRVDDAYL